MITSRAVVGQTLLVGIQLVNPVLMPVRVSPMELRVPEDYVHAVSRSLLT